MFQILYWAQFDINDDSTEDVERILDEVKSRARIIIAPMVDACVDEELLLLKTAGQKNMLNGTNDKLMIIITFYR